MHLLPTLTQARAPLVRQVQAWDEHGAERSLSIPAERALTVYVDKQELVTLMTLGAAPELLVLGYLRNQRLVDDVGAVESITVDWDCGEHGEGAAAIKTRHGIANLADRTAHKVVTTGCGQGSVFGGLMDNVAQLAVPAHAGISTTELRGLLDAIRLQESTYKSAGSVHGCALFRGAELRYFVEDVGRHNAIDTIAGWMWMQGDAATRGDDKVFYTTGRLTSEMILKAAQMGVAVVVSRSGITQMGYELAQQIGLCAIGRAMNQHYLCYTTPSRLRRD